MNAWYRIKAWWLARNSADTPVDVISEQMNEPRQLPLGAEEFDTWAARIISGVPAMDGVTVESMQYALASMILQLGPTESHKPDIHFLKSLLKTAANQVAHAKATAIRDARKAAEPQPPPDPAAAATLARLAVVGATP